MTVLLALALALSALQNPAPVIDSVAAAPPGLSQTVAPIYGGSFVLNIHGRNFTSTSTIQLSGTPLTTIFLTDTDLTAIIPTASIATAGPLNVRVSNSGTLSNSVVLTIVARADVNQNGAINIGDALATALSVGNLIRPAIPDSVDDINLNGTANIGDALALALFAGRLIANLPSPAIESVSSPIASAGSTLTITGSGFSAEPSSNQISFATSDGGVRVMPSSATTTSLVVTIPSNAMSGAIQVYRTDIPVAGGQFPLQIAGSPVPLMITSLKPVKADPGSTLTISGLGFDTTPANNSVQFRSTTGTIAGTVQSATSTLLTVTIPPSALCGSVTVAAYAQTSTSRALLMNNDCVLHLDGIVGKASPGDVAIVEGTGFDVVTPSNNVVRFGTTSATVLSAGGTELQVIVPENATGDVTVSVGAATSNAISQQTLPAKPSLQSVAPANAPAGTTATVTLTGAGFVSGATTVAVGGSGVTVSNVQVVNATTLTANLTLDISVNGLRNIRVTTAAGTSSDVLFYIFAAPLNVSTITPSIAVPGSTLNLTLNGVSFVPGATTVTMSGSGATLRDVNVVSSTKITATLAVNVGATLGTRDITVSTVFGSNRASVSIAPSVMSAAIQVRFRPLAGGNPQTVDGTGPSAGFLNPGPVWGDGTNLYVSDSQSHVIRKVVIATRVVTTIAGMSGVSGSADGVGSSARFSSPRGLWGDGHNLYILDNGNGTIRRMDLTTGNVVTFAGVPGDLRIADGSASTARFRYLGDIWADDTFLYVSDNATVRRVTIATKDVITLAGKEGGGFDADGIGTAASFYSIAAIWGDTTNLYIGDGIHSIRKMELSTRRVTTLAHGKFQRVTDGPLDKANLSYTSDLWGDGSSLFFIDGTDIRKIDLSTGLVTTLSANMSEFGFDDGVVTNKRVNGVRGLWGDANHLYFVEFFNYAIRIVDPDMTAPSIADITPDSGLQLATVHVVVHGTNFVPGFTTLQLPTSGRDGIPPLSYQNLVVNDSSTLSADLLIDPTAYAIAYDVRISTPAGVTGYVGFTVGQPQLSSVSPTTLTRGASVEFTFRGTNLLPGMILSGFYYGTYHPISSNENTVVMRIDIPLNLPLGPLNIGLTNQQGVETDRLTVNVVDPVPESGTQLSMLTISREFNHPGGITGTANFLYVADSFTSTIREVSFNGTNRTLAGSGSPGSNDGNGVNASFNTPQGVWTDGTYVYVADSPNATIRRITIATGDVITIAGSAGQHDFVNGVGSNARFYSPQGLWGDGANLYVTDNLGNAVRKIVLATREVSTLSAQLHSPYGIWGDGTYLYVSNQNHTIVRMSISTGEILETAGAPDISGSEDGPAAQARFYIPVGLWGDGHQNLYIVDCFNHTLRKWNLATGDVTTMAGAVDQGGIWDAQGLDARFANAQYIWGDGTYLYVTDYNAIRRAAFIPAPEITRITPSSALPGSTIPIVVTGKNFLSDAYLTFIGGYPNYAITNFTVVNDTTITGTAYVAPGAPPSIAQIQVLSSVRSYPRSFTIAALDVPTLADVSPASVGRGIPATIVLTGTQFDNSSVVNVSGAGATIMSQTLNSSTSLTATILIDGNQPTGSRNITVTTLTGTTGSKALTVTTPPSPTISSVTPASSFVGFPTTIVLAGSNFLSGATSLNFSGSGVTITSITGLTPSQLTANLAIDAGAATGSRNLVVTTSSGNSAPIPFSITAPIAPSVNSVSPNTIVRGIPLRLTLTGSNFIPGATTVSIAGTSNRITSVDILGSSSLTATIWTGFDSTTGPVIVTVTTPAGSTNGTVSLITPPMALAGQLMVSTLSNPGTITGIWGDGTFLYFTVTGSIRKYEISTGTTTTLASWNGAANGIWGDGKYLYITDSALHVIWKIDATTGVSTVFAGTPGFAGTINYPGGLWGDGSYLYFTDYTSVLKADLTTAQISTLATGFVNPFKLWSDGTNLFIGDSFNQGVRKVTISTGQVTTFSSIYNSSPSAISGDGINLYVSYPGILRALSLTNAESSDLAGNSGVYGWQDGTGRFTLLRGPGPSWTDGATLYFGDADYLRKAVPDPTAPGIFSVNPPRVAHGSTVNIVVTGTHFVAGQTALQFNTTDIKVNSATVTDGNHITASIDVGPARTNTIPPIGLTVTTPAGTSYLHAIGVDVAAKPTLTGMTPAGAIRGGTVQVVLTGSSFVAGATNIVADFNGLTSSNVAVVGNTTLTATIQLDITAPLGSQLIRVVNESGSSATLPITIVANTPPAVTSILPAVGSPGTSVAATFVGSGFVPGATSISVSGTGVTVSNATALSSTLAKATLILDPGASGVRGVTVTSITGTSAPIPLSIEAPSTPALQTVTPSTVYSAVPVQVVMTGGGFVPGATVVNISGTGISVLSMNVSSGSTLNATLWIASDAVQGVRNVSLTTPSGPSNAMSFNIGTPPIDAAVQLQVSTIQVAVQSPFWSDTQSLYGQGCTIVSKYDLTSGAVTTIAGGVQGSQDGVGLDARFGCLQGGWSDGTYFYLTDSTNHSIRRMTIATNEVTTLLTAANFDPTGIWGDGINLYVVANHAIRQISIATGQMSVLAGVVQSTGSADGTGSAARFNNPKQIWGDGQNLYVTDFNSGTIRKIVITTGEVTTLAGTANSFTLTDGIGSAARFQGPSAIWGDGSNLYVLDGFQGAYVRKIVIASEEVITLAGSGSGSPLDGTGPNSRLSGAGYFWGDGSIFWIVSNFGLRKAIPNTTAPVLQTISPITGARGSTANVTLSGLNFASGSTITVSGSGITVNNIVVVNSSKITADFIIDAAASTSSRTVKVTGSNGTTYTRFFTPSP